jgi:hypothetical protein
LLGSSQRWRAGGFAWATISLAASYFAFEILPRRAELGQNLASFDMYAWVYPNILYTLHALE